MNSAKSRAAIKKHWYFFLILENNQISTVRGDAVGFIHTEKAQQFAIVCIKANDFEELESYN